ncbi:hypothetical protein [Bradyrhizobium sp. RDI18]
MRIGYHSTQQVLQMLRHTVDLLGRQATGIKVPPKAPIESANLKRQQITE